MVLLEEPLWPDGWSGKWSEITLEERSIWLLEEPESLGNLAANVNALVMSEFAGYSALVRVHLKKASVVVASSHGSYPQGD